MLYVVLREGASVDDQVRDVLKDLMATSGRNLCTMPRMFGILMRQRCPSGAGQVRELEQTLESGCVGPILAATGPVDEPALAEQLAARCGLASDRARWAITTWVSALDAADVPTDSTLGRDWSVWNRLDVSAATTGGGGAFTRSVWHLGVVGLGGGVGGMSLGCYLLTGGDPALIDLWRAALEDLSPWLQALLLLTLGFTGGSVGGLLGWIFGGGRSWMYEAIGSATLGRAVLSSIGAFHGAGVGAMACLGFFGLIGVMPGALAGAALGAFLGHLVAEQIARFRRIW
jgi:hypothetical protein